MSLCTISLSVTNCYMHSPPQLMLDVDLLFIPPPDPGLEKLSCSGWDADRCRVCRGGTCRRSCCTGHVLVEGVCGLCKNGLVACLLWFVCETLLENKLCVCSVLGFIAVAGTMCGET